MAKKVKPKMGKEGKDPISVDSDEEKTSSPSVSEDVVMTALEFGQLNGFSNVDKSAVSRKYKNEKRKAISWAREFKNKVNF